MTEYKQMRTNDYHYTESGLDNIYLVNGHRFVDGPRGRQIIIEDIEGLHRAIGEMLITCRKNLSGKEIRFLRQELLMSQATLAKLLGVSERAVLRWEKGKTGQVPGPAEAAIRVLYRESLDEGGSEPGVMRSMLRRIAEMEDELQESALRQRRALRRDGKMGWRSDLAEENAAERHDNHCEVVF